MRDKPAVRVSRPRLTILARLYLWGIFGLGLAFPLTFWAVGTVADEQARQQIDHAISGGTIAFEMEFERANHYLTGIGSWLIKHSEVIAAVRNRDSDALARLLAPVLNTGSAIGLLVTDADGVVLVALQSDDLAVPGDVKPELSGIKSALAGTESQQLIQDQGGRLQWRRLLPIYDMASQPPIGMLAVGFSLGEPFLKYVATDPLTEIAIIHNGQIAVTTLTDRNGVPWTGRAVPEGAAGMERPNGLGATVLLPTDNGEYVFRFKSLRVPGGSTPVLFGAGVARPRVFDYGDTLGRAAAASLLGNFAILALIGLLAARTFVLPIRELDTAAQAMAAGDLSKAIRVTGHHELGDLAHQIEAMRQRMQSMSSEINRYAAAISSMGVAVVMTDPNGRIVRANRAAEALLKQDQDSLLRQPWHQIFVASNSQGGSETSSWNAGPVGADSEVGMIVRGRFPLRTQPRLVVDMVSSQFDVDGVPAGYIHVLQDVSVLEQLTHAKDEFLLNIAHELRAPLASLRASIDLLIEDYSVMSKHDFGVMLRTFRRSTVKFQTLVETLIDVGRVQGGHFRVQPAPTEFNRLIQDAVSQVEPLLAAQNQPLELDIECSSPCIVLADRARIIQVIINLLTNANKYSPENQPIGLCAYVEGGHVYLEVTDHGPGIAPEEQANLFQRFYRSKRAEEEGVGIGLGLALAKGIIEAHGGQIGFRSQPGTGTTFWFSLETVSPSDH